MSALIGHAKAAKILAATFWEEAQTAHKPLSQGWEIMSGLARVHQIAAERMEDAMRQEATAWTPPLPSDGLGK